MSEPNNIFILIFITTSLHNISICNKIIRVKIAYAVKARTPYMMRGSGVQESLKKKMKSESNGWKCESLNSTWACWCMGRVFPRSWRWAMLCPSQRSSPLWGRVRRRRCRPSHKSLWLPACPAWRTSLTRQHVPVRIFLFNNSPLRCCMTKSPLGWKWWQWGQGQQRACSPRELVFAQLLGCSAPAGWMHMPGSQQQHWGISWCRSTPILGVPTTFNRIG